jgi:hypothetical protein
VTVSLCNITGTSQVPVALRKINIQKLQKIGSTKNHLSQTTFGTQSTTFCPQINHAQTPKNSKTPGKKCLFSSEFFRQQKPKN